MRRHSAHRGLRTDLFAVTGVSLLVIALAVVAVLSIVAGSRADDRDERPVTDISDVEPSGDLGR